MWFKYEDFDNLEQAINTYKYWLDIDYMDEKEFEDMENIVDIESAIKDITQQLNESFYDIPLRDNDNAFFDYGGTSYSHETVKNFIEEINFKGTNLKELNKHLIDNGFEPIRVKKNIVANYTYEDMSKLEKSLFQDLECLLGSQMYEEEDINKIDNLLDIYENLNTRRKIVANVWNNMDFITKYHDLVFTYLDKEINKEIEQLNK